jgi:hypothetical protein
MLVLSFVLLAAHTALLGDWLVDDAGISFSYARNLARGFGLVSQPGIEPVEGFSNPLWTIGLAPLFLTGTFAPWTVKVLSLGLLGATFWLITRRAAGPGAAAWLAASPPVFLALNTSFVVWTTSGLENPLLAFLVAVSATLTVRAARGENGRLDIGAGVVAGLLALTRPDAVVYAAAYPFVLCVAPWSEGRRRLVGRALAYATGFGMLFGPYLLFRRLYFNDWVPNTFHAKVRPWMLTFDPARVWELLESATGGLAVLVILLAAVQATQMVRAERRDPRRLVLLLYLVLAGAAYLLLPPDWMGEYRFATAFFLFFAWLLGDALAGLWEGLDRAGSAARWLTLAAALLFLTRSTSVHASRSSDFARNPTVPFARISEFAQAYDRLAATLPPGEHSLLAPDLGGTLFYAKLRVFDLAGLCDRTIARTLMGHREAFHDYVFETARPTFIHIHASWADWAALHGDPRFARDYAPLFEVWTRPEGAEPAQEGEPWSGDYVRREAVPTPERLAQLREDFDHLGLRRPLP